MAKKNKLKIKYKIKLKILKTNLGIYAKLILKPYKKFKRSPKINKTLLSRPTKISTKNPPLSL